MAHNKIILGNETLIDLTGDTVEADKLLQGYTAHDSSGSLITGTLVPSAASVGLIFSDWDSSGRPTTVTTVGLTTLPAWFFWQLSNNRYNRANWNSKLVTVYINEGVTSSAENLCRDSYGLKNVYFPSTFVTLQGSYAFVNTSVQLLDFSSATRIVTLTTTSNFGLSSGCVIRVPQALLTDWQNETNWCDLTNVVWEGV